MKSRSLRRMALAAALSSIALFTACSDDPAQIIDASVDTPIDSGGQQSDRDGDGIDDTADNCPDNPNADQANHDADSQGDVCDADDDNDTVADAGDNCPLDANTDQANHDTDAAGDACDTDDDDDGLLDTADNCPTAANPGQDNNDGDADGDLCDLDDDNDTVADATDNCATTANTDQANHDTDPDGDACDADDDNDGLLDAVDNCPTADNLGQEDTDANLTPSAAAGAFNLRPAPTTVAVSGDDSISGPLPIGFTFNFFGQPQTEFNAYVNGLISFGPDTSNNGCCNGFVIPEAATPNNWIGLYQVDLNTAGGGTITYATTGTPPNRELVVSWNAVAHYSGGGQPVTGQIILHETTNVVELLCATCVTDGRNHTQGIEDSTGAVAAFLPGRSATSWSASNDAVFITPGSPVPDGVGDACDVCPATFDPGQEDADGDGLGDACDICPADADPMQTETDGDFIGDACDNCPADANADQSDLDNDGIGDVCDDSDGDGVFDVDDNCPTTANPGQEDSDPSIIGEFATAIGGHDDGLPGGGDGIGDACDNCPFDSNPTQADVDNDGIGDVCEDSDGDGTYDVDDNCPLIANPSQADADGDGIGDACDSDGDNDGVADATDNCPLVANPTQADVDSDGIGDACDDSDGDGVLDSLDNCPATPNPTQADGDGEEGGGDGVGQACDNCPLVANPTQADSNSNGVGDACENTSCATPVADGCVATEVCGNGADDNCNGLVDENCACSPGSVQACFRGPPGRRNVGACIDGQQICNTAGTSWGTCVGGISPGAEACDGLDNNCNGCSDDNPSCTTVLLACPAPDSLPEGAPFVDYVINASNFYQGAVQSYSWEVTGGPCDRLFLTTTSPVRQSFTLSGQTTSTLTLRPTLSGDYIVKVRITAVGGQVYVCTFVVHVANPGLRVELCSDRSAQTDIDLHLHRSGTTTPWFTLTDDCFYQNCKAGSSGAPNWSYANSPIAECVGGPEGAQWQSLGYCRNPRLDIDSINNNGVPENINVDNPNNGETFRVMAHYYSGTGAVHPLVNIYCAGVLRASYGAAPNELTNFTVSGSSTGNTWRVVDATMQVVAGVTTGCTLAPLHPPSQTTGYYVTNDRNY